MQSIIKTTKNRMNSTSNLQQIMLKYKTIQYLYYKSLIIN